MKRESATRKSRAAFTLVELIVVIGLMGLLATISIAGYNAASNGMKNRAVMQDTISLMRQAMQTALIDNTVTAVLFYNQQSDESNEGKPTGFAIAIRQAGRLTMGTDNQDNRDGLLIDEFADWNNSYSTKPDSESSQNDGIRFFRMQDRNQLEGGLDRCSSVVYPYVSSLSKCSDYMIMAGATLRTWAEKKNLNARYLSENEQNSSNNDDDSSFRKGKFSLWGFKMKTENGLKWQAGDAYGTEFASLQLPEGFIFGSSKPSPGKMQPASVAAIVFDPLDSQSGGVISMGKSIPLAKVTTTKTTQIGTVTDNLLKDK